MISEEFEDTILEHVERYVQARARSTDGNGHDVYLALQRLQQLCAPSVIYRLIMQTRDYRKKLRELASEYPLSEVFGDEQC